MKDLCKKGKERNLIDSVSVYSASPGRAMTMRSRVYSDSFMSPMALRAGTQGLLERTHDDEDNQF